MKDTVEIRYEKSGKLTIHLLELMAVPEAMREEWIANKVRADMEKIKTIEYLWWPTFDKQTIPDVAVPLKEKAVIGGTS